MSEHTHEAGAHLPGGHGHGHGPLPRLRVGRVATVVVLALLTLVAAVAVAGVLHYWPAHAKVEKARGAAAYAAPGVTFPKATVVKVLPLCPPGSAGGSAGDEVGGTTDDSSASGTAPDVATATGTPDDTLTCGGLTAKVEEGSSRGTTVSVQIAPGQTRSGIRAGDTITVMDVPSLDGPNVYAFNDVDRALPLWLLAAVFAVVVLAVARLRGLMAMIGIGVAGVVMLKFALPAALVGEPAVPVIVVASTLIMFVVLYATHGLSMRTSVALLGTVFGVAVTAAVAYWAVGDLRLSGLSDENASDLSAYLPHLSLSMILVASVVLAGLGTLNDVTITQASSVWELRAASPELTRWDVFRSAMRIGRDHVASSIYTLVFAYLGTGLVLFLAAQLYDLSLGALGNSELVASEILRSLVGGIGLVLAMPLTTLLAVAVIPGSDLSVVVERGTPDETTTMDALFAPDPLPVAQQTHDLRTGTAEVPRITD